MQQQFHMGIVWVFPSFSVGMHAAPREVFVLSTQVYKEHFLDAIKNETVG